VAHADLSRKIVTAILDEALCHPRGKVNQGFSKPTDGPKTLTSSPGDGGHNLYNRPLITGDHNSYWLLDRSVCALPCLEALMTVARPSTKDFDRKLGLAIESFLRETLLDHKIATLTGKYKSGGEEGECDLVIETSEVIIFLEIKKKPLTRLAQSGSTPHVLIDLANSVLAAQAQAGWHEVRLRKHNFLDLRANGAVTRLDVSALEHRVHPTSKCTRKEGWSGCPDLAAARSNARTADIHAFRKLIVPAHHRLIRHNNLEAIRLGASLSAAPVEKWKQFGLISGISWT